VDRRGRMGFEMAKRLASELSFPRRRDQRLSLERRHGVPASAGTTRVAATALGFPFCAGRQSARRHVWNRNPFQSRASDRYGARIADHLYDLAACDVVFCMVSTWNDVKEVIARAPMIAIARQSAADRRECSSRLGTKSCRPIDREMLRRRRAVACNACAQASQPQLLGRASKSEIDSIRRRSAALAAR